MPLGCAELLPNASETRRALEKEALEYCAEVDNRLKQKKKRKKVNARIRRRKLKQVQFEEFIFLKRVRFGCTSYWPPLHPAAQETTETFSSEGECPPKMDKTSFSGQKVCAASELCMSRIFTDPIPASACLSHPVCSPFPRSSSARNV